MDENKIIRYCTILLIYDDNHSKIFVSEKLSTIVNMVIIDQYT